MAYIEMKHSYKRYQVGDTEIVANRDVNFEIEKGELVIILGASGAGKSTVLNLSSPAFWRGATASLHCTRCS